MVQGRIKMQKSNKYTKVQASPGIRMKVLNSVPISEADDDHEEDEFQHLIIMPHNPMKGRLALGLRFLFFGLLSISIISILFVLIKDMEQKPVIWLPSSQLINNLNLQKNTSKLNSSTQETTGDVCLIEDSSKFDCFPAEGATADECLSRGCCWKPLDTHKVPWCFYPLGFSYYTFSNFTPTKNGIRGSAVSTRKSPYPDDVKNLMIEITYETEDILRLKITDAKQARYEVPLEYTSNNNKKPDILNYSVETSREGIKVFRFAELTPIFDTTIAPMTYANQFLEISTSLQTQYLYGIGESVDSLKRNVNGSRFILYSHDRIPGPNTNNYGSHPFYMVMDKLGRSYGVFLANSNAMEISVQPTPSLTFRTIGGVIDILIFIGPKPSEVTDQYTSIIGRPMIPPYWSLGFHLCRFNYGTINHTAEILEKNLRKGLPIDVQWNDLDYMENHNDFTFDPVKFAGLPDFVNSIHAKGMRYIPLIDPGISSGEGEGKYPAYDEGVKMDIFIKNYLGRIFEGKVWNKKSTVWPDFSHPNVTKYWLNQLDSFRKKVEFDGAWIDMNEPSNFYDGEKPKDGCLKTSPLDNPPFVPKVDGKVLYYKSICPSAKQAGGSHYDLHNLYGIQEAKVTYNVLGDITGQRPFIISRSTFPGHGRFAGHWTGDVISNWEDLRQTIPQILSFGLFGIPMVGADICGFNGNTTIDLCKRWQQLGAFYPFARNHNTDDGIAQDPASLGPEVFEAAKETLRVRYDMLPYIYSLFFRAHLSGRPVARPLFYEFPKDVNTFSIDTQFMLGPAVMIVPILEENYTKQTITAYLPKGFWYSHYSQEVIESLSEERELDIPNKNAIPILYRGGSVVIKQKNVAQNTVQSRKSKFSIEVYLSDADTAYGEFFWDDGVSNLPKELGQYNHYSLSVAKNILTMSKVFDGYDSSGMVLGEIIIRGVLAPVKQAILNNVPFLFVYENKILMMKNLTLQGPTGWTDGLQLIWTY